MSIKAILFDHDGTIVDSESIHFYFWKKVLSKYNLKLSEEEYIKYYSGLPAKAKAADAVSRYNINQDPKILEKDKKIELSKYLKNNSFPIMDGAIDAINELINLGIKIGVVTGTNYDNLKNTLDSNPVFSKLSVVITGDDVSNNKPHPECYLLALSKLGIKPSECLAIEDTEIGLISANKAGIDCIVVPTEMSKNHNFNDAKAVFNNVYHIVEYVRNLSNINI